MILDTGSWNGLSIICSVCVGARVPLQDITWEYTKCKAATARVSRAPDHSLKGEDVTTALPHRT